MSVFSRIAAAVIFTLMIFSPAGAASQPRDADANAMVFNGAYTKQELVTKLKNGDGHHSGAELRKEFSTLGVSVKQIQSSDMKNGVVTKSGKVIVGSKTVATEANSYGHGNLPGSHLSNGLYVRPTSVSFDQSQLQAFVYMPDGKFKYAIIKSCGNFVKATPVAAPVKKTVKTAQPVVIQQQQQQQVIINQPAPAPAPTPVPTPAPTQPAPQPLPQTGVAATSLAGLATMLTVSWYALRSRRSLVASHLAR